MLFPKSLRQLTSCCTSIPPSILWCNPSRTTTEQLATHEMARLRIWIQFAVHSMGTLTGDNHARWTCHHSKHSFSLFVWPLAPLWPPLDLCPHLFWMRFRWLPELENVFPGTLPSSAPAPLRFREWILFLNIIYLWSWAATSLASRRWGYWCVFIAPANCVRPFVVAGSCAFFMAVSIWTKCANWSKLNVLCRLIESFSSRAYIFYLVNKYLRVKMH